MANKRSKVILIAIGGVIFLFILISLLRNKEVIEEQRQVATGPLPVSVSVYEVSKEKVAESLSLLGTIIPSKEATILSEVQGQVTALPINRGDYINKGSLMAKVDIGEKGLAFESSKVALEKARRDYERFLTLYEGKAVTKRQLEDARSALENAKVAYQQSSDQLGKSTINAPFSGTVTDVFIEQGAIIMPGNKVANMVDVSSLEVNLTVPEAQAYQIQEGDKVEVKTSIYPDVNFKGKVSYVSPTGDEAHNYVVEVTLENRNDYPLKAGTYVTVNFGEVSSGKPMVIPRDALIGGIENPQVYVVENGVAKVKDIKIGQTFNEKVEVTEGLNEGEKVVVTGLINLKDNSPVKIIK